MQMLFGFGGNPWEWMVIALIILVFFGNRMPTVMRNLGKGVTEFKKGVAGIEDDDGKSESGPKAPEQKPA